MGNCCQGLSNRIRRILRINGPTGNVNQANDNNDAEQRLPILNETPPMADQDFLSSETTSPGLEQDELPIYHISPTVSRPLSEMTDEEQLGICQKLAVIGQMASTIVREEDKIKECVICMVDFETGVTVRYLPCTHSFHKECIDTWLMRVLNCPTCTKEIRLSDLTD